MTRRLLQAAAIALISASLACVGEPGPQGPAGSAGAAGENGADGLNGANALTRATPEAAGANCANGGTRIEVGLDLDGNGVLDGNEVNSGATSFVCNGTGKSALVRTSVEAAGTNCPVGGIRIETGLDADNDGVLDDSEINASATTYACNVAPSGSVSTTTGIRIVIAEGDVSTSTTGPVTVRFRLRDDRGYPVDINGVYSVNTKIQPRFGLAWFTKDANGIVSPLNVYSKSGSNPMPTMYTAGSTGQGTVTENGYGAGDYTYTFPATTTAGGAVAVAYDATKLGETHVVWVSATRQTDTLYTSNANTFFTANQSYYFVPNGTATPLKREIVTSENCNSCHNGFKPEKTTSDAFHGGNRNDPGICNMCHNPGRTSNPAANSSVFVHRIHHGEELQTANQFHGIAATYPQDIRNCDACHAGAAQGAQAQTVPTRAACGSCHDYVKFDATAAASCTVPATVDAATGLPVVCNHAGSVQANDSTCALCHSATKVAGYHTPVVPPNPGNTWAGGTNANTNAAYMAATGFVPTGAAVITYDLKSVDTWDDNGVKRPSMTFKLKKNGVDVVFADPKTATEIMPGFMGSPSAYFAFAVPQDGIAKPADFNASASGYIKTIWNGTATGTGAGTLTGPDASGYYTIKLTGVVIPAEATMLTGGLGYTYSLSGTPPLTQIDLPAYPLSTDGKNQGGLIVPTPNVWKVATGFTGRRAIVETARCNNCHGALGVAPSFHAGQRNDGPTCSFCHTPNRTSSGWSAGSKSFIHAVHGARQRTVGFTWHASSPTATYAEIEFPGQLNDCTSCHLPNTYDFTGTASAAALPNWTVATVATGKYNGTSPTAYTLSPYVMADNLTDYGAGFSYNAATGVSTPAAGTTLVISPVTSVCASCHDSSLSISHMTSSGGAFYAPRSQVAGTSQEQCMICHGPGRVAAIGEVHKK